MKKLALMLICMVLAVPFSVSAGEDRALSNEEIADILFRMSREENEESEYLVLPEDYQEPVTGLDGEFKLLLVGVDTDDPQIRGRSDTMILAVLNKRKCELKLISFMRDLYVQIPGKAHNRLNAAYAFGGPELLKKTLDKCFHVKPDGYLAVNFAMMAKLVDSIGGVEIEVESEELRPLNGILEYYNYLKKRPGKQGRLENAGRQTLTGLQAMSYARIRKIDSDFERVARQQRVIMAIFNKIKRMSVEEIMNILSENIDSVATDITMQQAVQLAGELSAMDSITTRYLRIPVVNGAKSTVLNDAYYLIPNLQKNQRAIDAFLAPSP